jgi:hypothetical protein
MKKVSNTQMLVDGISKVIVEVSKNNLIHLQELMDAVCQQLSVIANVSSKNSSSVGFLDLEEKAILDKVTLTIRSIFEKRRQELISQTPPEALITAALTKEKVLASIKQMLFSQSMTPDEGLALIGELVSTVTYIRSPTVENSDQVQQIEAKTLEHIKGKLSLALEAIQVQQGFVTKQ